MKWEYKVFTLENFLNSEGNLSVEEILNKYGKEGWELTGVLEKPYTTPGNPPAIDSDSIVFKRQVQ